MRLDEDKEQRTQDSRRCLVTTSTVLILLSVCSVSLFRRVMLLGHAAALFQFQSSGGRKGGQLGDKLRPLGRAAPVAHRWGVFSSEGEAAGWNRKQGSLHS